MTNTENVRADGIRHSGFVIDSSFVIRHSSLRARGAFTLIELILVMGILSVLAALVLSTAGYARKKSALARAEAEIAAMAAAIENYKADNGIYPRGPASAMTIGTITIPANATDNLNAKTRGDPTNTTDPTYGETSLYLYTLLSGDSTGNRSPTGKSYMAFKPNMLLPAGGTGTVTAIADPFGNSYGYSTANQVDPVNTGYNPSFDLWSTAGLTTAGQPTQAAQNQWIKNW
jgi:prepilin-type N-terminal cleavage/methylation domain-containing protein